MENLIILKRSDLEELLKQIFSDTKPEPVEQVNKSKLNINEALTYLNDKGYSISKSTMYKHTMAGTIPFQRFGERRLVFNANELDLWLSEQLSGSDNRVNEITKSVANSARRKERS